MNAPTASLRYQASREIAGLNKEEIGRLRQYYKGEMDRTCGVLGDIDYYTSEYGDRVSPAIDQVDDTQRQYARTLIREQALLEAIEARRQTSIIYRMASFVVGKFVCPDSAAAVKRDSILCESYVQSAEQAERATSEVVDLAQRGEMSHERSEYELDWQQLSLMMAEQGLARLANRRTRRY